MASGKPHAARVSAGTVANEMRSEQPGSVLGLLGLSIVIAYIHVAFRPYVDRLALDLWTLAMAAFLGVWLGALLVIRQRRPSDDELLRIWAPGGRAITTMCNLAVAASVWLLLPNAPDGLRMVMFVLYLCYVMVQLSISTEGTQVALGSVAAVIGSLIAYVGTTGEPYALPLALFLAMNGGILLAVRRFIRLNVVAATEASERLRAALAVVAAERDARTRFIRSASHDLSQPLQAARLFFDRMRRAHDPAERERSAAGVTRAFASTAALLDEMLMHLRLDAGAVRSVAEAVSVDDFAAQLAFDHGPAAAEAGMRVRTPCSGLGVQADPHLLKRVLGNFVANGIRHSLGENVLIAARRFGPARVRIWVLDDGDGVDAGLRSRLFEDFAQGTGGPARAGGFGLGLASARKLAQAMDGTVGFEPRWRSGGAFFIELPAATATPAAQKRPPLAA